MTESPLDAVLLGEVALTLVGQAQPLRVTVVDYLTDDELRPIYLVGADGAIYPWPNIVRLRRT